MATLKIDASDLLGKLHVAAIDKVNEKYKSALGQLKKLLKGRFGGATIQNTAFDDKTGKLNLPPGNGDAEIVVASTGVNAWKEAKDMMKTYMQWFAGMPDFDLDKWIEGNKSTRDDVGATHDKEGVVSRQWTIPYQLTATEKGTQEIKDFASATDTKTQQSATDSDVIDANESVEAASSRKVKAWESEHPFESIFNKQSKENSTMVKESKTKKFVKQVAKHKNVAAQRTLEAIMREKVEKRVKDVLAEEK